jgi:hypothetical protein
MGGCTGEADAPFPEREDEVKGDEEGPADESDDEQG